MSVDHRLDYINQKDLLINLIKSQAKFQKSCNQGYKRYLDFFQQTDVQLKNNKFLLFKFWLIKSLNSLSVKAVTVAIIGAVLVFFLSFPIYKNLFLQVISQTTGTARNELDSLSNNNSWSGQSCDQDCQQQKLLANPANKDNSKDTSSSLSKTNLQSIRPASFLENKQVTLSETYTSNNYPELSFKYPADWFLFIQNIPFEYQDSKGKSLQTDDLGLAMVGANFTLTKNNNQLEINVLPRIEKNSPSQGDLTLECISSQSSKILIKKNQDSQEQNLSANQLSSGILQTEISQNSFYQPKDSSWNKNYSKLVFFLDLEALKLAPNSKTPEATLSKLQSKELLACFYLSKASEGLGFKIIPTRYQVQKQQIEALVTIELKITEDSNQQILEEAEEIIKSFSI